MIKFFWSPILWQSKFLSPYAWWLKLGFSHNPRRLDCWMVSKTLFGCHKINDQKHFITKSLVIETFWSPYVWLLKMGFDRHPKRPNCWMEIKTFFKYHIIGGCNFAIEAMFTMWKKANMWPTHLQLLATIWFLQLKFCPLWLMWHHVNINWFTYD